MKTRIATLGALLFTVLTLGMAAPPSPSFEPEKYFTVTGVDLYEVVGGHEQFVNRMPMATPTDKPGPTPTDVPPGPTVPPFPGTGTGGIDPGSIISIGEKIWEIIQANRPVVTGNYSALSAVPQGIKSWDELEGWSEPTVRIYKLVYTNVYKMKVVEFEYRVAYTTNGSYNGTGRYLSRVEIDPKTLNVVWGYKFNATGLVLNVTNAGTKANPLAAVELSLDWSVESVLKHMGQSVRYYIRGDGLFKNLSDGTMAPGSLK